MKSRPPAILKPHWTNAEITYLRENYKTHSPAIMARRLGKSTRAVKLYIYRNGYDLVPRVARNVFLELLKKRFIRPEFFRPTKGFFREVKINQRRWWALYRGEVSLRDYEYIAMCSALAIQLSEAFELRQLSLFKQDDSTNDNR